MKTNKTLPRIAAGYVLFSCLSIFSVSVMALVDPQMVMNLVQTKLANTDAASSIRGVYGGVGLTMIVCLLYSLRRNLAESLGLLGIFWGLYAVSRIITIVADGQLGAFGTQWLVIESLFCAIALLLRRAVQKVQKPVPAFG
jgi:hypothetical protein